MLKYITMIPVLIFSFQAAFCQQPLWEISPGLNDYASVGNDTSVVNLKNLLLQNTDIGSYTSAATILAYHYGSRERDFVLDILRRNAYSTPIDYDGLKYFLYQQIRGFLGDRGAITGMDSIARFARYLDRQIRAVELLALAGFYEHFNIVREAYSQSFLMENAGACLLLYGRNPRYITQAGDLLAVTIRDSISILSVTIAAQILAEFDKPRAVVLLNQRFLVAEGDNRMLLFIELTIQDPDGQPERTVWAVPRELSEYNRDEYFPRFSYILEGNRSKRYLQPSFIKFTVDWLKTETSRLVTVDVFNSFVKVFKPLPPPPTTPVIVMLDTLISYKHQVASFGWLKDKKEDEKDGDKDKDDTIVKKLDKILEEARKELVKRDSIETREEMEEFVKKVEELRKESIKAEQQQKPEKILLTEEGYKFLYYNAKYIIERLPAKKK
ncbi:MAG: hypothetical protein HY276_00940 [Ignavibacteriales bacterium]|nr:hypothetical protein [Ignavibacteriales bacterium]